MTEYTDRNNRSFRTTQAASESGVVLTAERITKVYPGTTALNDVTYNVYHGKVNVLVGENGAGKSTLMKILAGVERFEKGRILLNGQEVAIRSPSDAKSLGIGIIHQELDLCLNMSVVDNIFLADEVRRFGIVDQKAQQRRTDELLSLLEHDIDPETDVGDLRVGEQQIVAIARALSEDISVLIMDEPTSSLSVGEVEVLFKVIEDLKARGISIVYISHKLDEVLRIGDRICVLRDACKVAEDLVSSVNLSWIVENMIGRKQSEMFSARMHKRGDVLLQVQDLCLPRVAGGYWVENVSFELRQGEILGIYGLAGAGRTELLECLLGAVRQATGSIKLHNEELGGRTISENIQAGIVLVPEDRQEAGLIQPLSVNDNLTLASLRTYLNRAGAYLDTGKTKKAASSMIEHLSIRVADGQQVVTSLSGGNQQKVVIGRSLLTKPKVLLLDEPTRGVDVGAKAEIFELIEKIAAQGYGVVFVSSELKEVLGMSDRILVMCKGVVTGEFNREDATEELLVEASMRRDELVAKSDDKVK